MNRHEFHECSRIVRKKICMSLGWTATHAGQMTEKQSLEFCFSILCSTVNVENFTANFCFKVI